MGGATMAIPTTAMTRTPKWSGCTPTDVAMGKRMGKKIRMAGRPSSIIPKTKKTTIVRSRNVYAAAADGLMKSPIMRGTW